MGIKVMLTEPIHPSGVALLISKGCVVTIASGAGEDAICKEVGEADAIIVRMSLITERILGAASRCRIVVRHGVGLDNIDLEAARRFGVRVVNLPDINTVSVAEYVVGAILLMAKQFHTYNTTMRNDWFDSRTNVISIDTSGRTLGVIGFGRIGRLVAEKCNLALGMDVLAWDPYVAPKEFTDRRILRADSLQELLKHSDFITIHLPKNTSTLNLLGEIEFQCVKQGAFLINASRGGIVDEESLVKALESGLLAGAVIDVFQSEPLPTGNPLLRLANVITTPHVAGVSQDAFERLSIGAAELVVSHFAL